MSSTTALTGGVGFILLGAVASLVLVRAPKPGDLAMSLLVVLGLVACGGVGAAVLLGGAPITVSIQPTVPGGPWAILVDPLAAWFLVVVGIAGGAATPYGVRYLVRERAQRPVAAASLAGLGLVGWYLRRWAGRSRVPAASPTWGCAYARPDARMQYTVSSFSAPVLQAFGTIAAPKVQREAASLTSDPRDRVLAGLVVPLWVRVRAGAEALRPLQQGRITRYLQYMVLTVLLLLGALFVAMVRHP